MTNFVAPQYGVEGSLYMYNNLKVKIMEKYGLVDKTKEELIEIALEQEETEKSISDKVL